MCSPSWYLCGKSRRQETYIEPPLRKNYLFFNGVRNTVGIYLIDQ